MKRFTEFQVSHTDGASRVTAQAHEKGWSFKWAGGEAFVPDCTFEQAEQIAEHIAAEVDDQLDPLRRELRRREADLGDWVKKQGGDR